VSWGTVEGGIGSIVRVRRPGRRHGRRGRRRWLRATMGKGRGGAARGAGVGARDCQGGAVRRTGAGAGDGRGGAARGAGAGAGAGAVRRGAVMVGRAGEVDDMKFIVGRGRGMGIGSGCHRSLSQKPRCTNSRMLWERAITALAKESMRMGSAMVPGAFAIRG
jgi:hypothetical protein